RTADAPLPFTSAGVSMKSPPRRVPRETESMPNGLSFCSRSRACSIRCERRKGSTQRGLIVMFRMGQPSTCFPGSRIRSNVLLLDSASAFWRAVFFALLILKQWTVILSAEMLQVVSPIYDNSCSGRVGAAMLRQRRIFTFARHPLRPEEESTECVVIMLQKWHFQGLNAKHNDPVSKRAP